MLTKLIIAVWVVIILIAVVYLYNPKTKDVLRFEELVSQELPVGSSMDQLRQFAERHNLDCGDFSPFALTSPGDVERYTCRTQLPDREFQTFLYFNMDREGKLVLAEVRDSIPRL